MIELLNDFAPMLMMFLIAFLMLVMIKLIDSM